MKILQVIPYFTPKMGGDVNVCYNISKLLANLGHNVTIVTTDFEIDKDYIDTLHGINIVCFKCVFNIGLFLYSPEINDWAKSNVQDFDVVHLHTFRSYQNNIICKYCANHNVPYVLQAHGSLRIGPKKRLSKLIYDLIWGNSILNDATKAVALTNVEAEQYTALGVDSGKIEIIANGIDIDWKISHNIGEFKSKYFINKNNKVVLYIGRLHESKGIDLLVRAFANLSDRMENVILAIIGPDAGNQLALKKLADELGIAKKVLFTGFITEDDKRKALIDADVFVTPKFSGFPVTILEACAYGAPVIITDRGDKINSIKDSIGAIVRYDSESLCNAMFNILTNDQLKNKIIERQKTLITDKFDWNLIIKEINNMYMGI